MANDYKPRQAPRSKGSGLLLGLFVGFLLGVTVAAVIAIYFFKSPMPFANKGVAPAKSGTLDAKGKGEDGKPRFDFYRILPGQEEPVTDKQLRDAAKQQAAKDKSDKNDKNDKDAAAQQPNDIYFIQAGSFQNPVEADNQKAKLALLGLEASVEPTNVPEKGTWYRIRIGPLSSVEEINRVRTQLAQNGIEGSLVKVKPVP